MIPEAEIGVYVGDDEGSGNDLTRVLRFLGDFKENFNLIFLKSLLVGFMDDFRKILYSMFFDYFHDHFNSASFWIGVPSLLFISHNRIHMS